MPTGPFYLRPNACPFPPFSPAIHPFDQTPSAREAAGVIDADAPVCLLILSANLHLHTYTHIHTCIHGHAVPKIYALRSDSTNNRFDWHTPVPVKCISECVPVHIYVYRRGEQNRVKRGGVRGEFSVRKNKGSWSYFTLSRPSRPSISPSQVHLQYLQLFFFFPPALFCRRMRRGTRSGREEGKNGVREMSLSVWCCRTALISQQCLSPVVSVLQRWTRTGRDKWFAWQRVKTKRHGSSKVFSFCVCLCVCPRTYARKLSYLSVLSTFPNI